MAELSIIIVSYNTRDYLRQCLRSVFEDSSVPAPEVIVVDNGSADGSPALVRAEFPAVTLIETGANLGFAKANNIGIKASDGRYVLLLNTDTEFQPGTLGAMVHFLDDHPEAAAVGPRLLHTDGTRQLSCYRFPTPARALRDQLFLTVLLADHPRWGDFRRWAHDQTRPVDFVIGAALLVRRAVIDEVGLLDEDFFMYAEETDWCCRMHRAGHQVYFTPDAQIVHHAGGSGKPMARRVFAEFSGSQARYFRKHHGVLGAATLRISLILGALLRIPLYAAAALAGGPRRARAMKTLRLWRDILCWNLRLWRTPGLRPAETAGTL